MTLAVPLTISSWDCVVALYYCVVRNRTMKHVSIKFCVKRGKAPLKHMKSYKDVEDKPHSWWPKNTSNLKSVDTRNSLTRDHQQTLKIMASELNVNKESIRFITITDLEHSGWWLLHDTALTANNAKDISGEERNCSAQSPFIFPLPGSSNFFSPPRIKLG